MTATENKDVMIDALKNQVEKLQKENRALKLERAALKLGSQQKEKEQKPVIVFNLTRYTASTILSEVCRHRRHIVINGRRGITVKDLKGRCRTRAIVEARQIAMYLLRLYTDLSLIKIGKWFNRDHTTVLHGIQTVENLMHTDQKFKDLVQSIEKRLKPENNLKAA